MRPAVFVDRDGTLIEEVGYLDRLDRLTLFPFSIDAVRLLNRAGFAVVVVTNQSGIARGLFDAPFVDEAHRTLAERFEAAGARIDAFYYCPHHPDGSVAALRRHCECRKPKPGLLTRAAADLDLDLRRSFGVGDRGQDVEAARAAGARGVLLRTGHGGRDAEPGTPVVDNLIAAVSWILTAS